MFLKFTQKVNLSRKLRTKKLENAMQAPALLLVFSKERKNKSSQKMRRKAKKKIT